MKAKKILSIIGCFTLTAVTCVCMLFSVGCYKNEPKKEADGLIITPGEVQGDMISLLTQGPTDGTTEYTLTVVLNADCPDDMKAIDWSVAWKNSSSEWATGKVVTDYVTVTPTADGALTAKVKKVAAFGEQVIVTVTSRVLPELKATATVDCLMEFTLAVHSITIKLGDVFSFYPGYFKYGEGTLTGTRSKTEFMLMTSTGTLSVTLKPLTDSLVETYGRASDGQPKVFLPLIPRGHFDGEVFSVDSMFKFNSELSESEIEEIKNGAVYKKTWNQILNLFNSGKIDCAKFFNKETYNGKEVKTVMSDTVPVTFDTSALTPYALVTNVSLADSSIIF